MNKFSGCTSDELTVLQHSLRESRKTSPFPGLSDRLLQEAIDQFNSNTQNITISLSGFDDGARRRNQ